MALIYKRPKISIFDISIPIYVKMLIYKKVNTRANI